MALATLFAGKAYLEIGITGRPAPIAYPTSYPVVDEFMIVSNEAHDEFSLSPSRHCGALEQSVVNARACRIMTNGDLFFDQQITNSSMEVSGLVEEEQADTLRIKDELVVRFRHFEKSLKEDRSLHLILQRICLLLRTPAKLAEVDLRRRGGFVLFCLQCGFIVGLRKHGEDARNEVTLVAVGIEAKRPVDGLRESCQIGRIRRETESYVGNLGLHHPQGSCALNKRPENTSSSRFYQLWVSTTSGPRRDLTHELIGAKCPGALRMPRKVAQAIHAPALLQPQSWPLDEPLDVQVFRQSRASMRNERPVQGTETPWSQEDGRR